MRRHMSAYPLLPKLALISDISGESFPPSSLFSPTAVKPCRVERVTKRDEKLGSAVASLLFSHHLAAYLALFLVVLLILPKGCAFEREKGRGRVEEDTLPASSLRRAPHPPSSRRTCATCPPCAGLPSPRTPSCRTFTSRKQTQHTHTNTNMSVVFVFFPVIGRLLLASFWSINVIERK